MYMATKVVGVKHAGNHGFKSRTNRHFVICRELAMSVLYKSKKQKEDMLITYWIP